MANTKITSRVLADDAVLTANITDANVTTAKIADSNVTVAKMAANSVDSDQYVDGSIDTAHIANDQITTALIADDVALGGNPTTTTQSGSNSSTRIATTAFVQQELTTLIGGAPSTLNDLNELAAAINDDANYNSTLTTALATKLPLAGGTMTGNTRLNDNVKHKYGSGDYFQIYHDGTNANITNGAGHLTIDLTIADKDFIVKGTDGSTDITALTLDMSNAGKATFNNGATLGEASDITSSTAAGALLTVHNSFSSDANNGLLVRAGANESDGKILELQDHAGNTDFVVYGDGAAAFTGTLAAGASTFSGEVIAQHATDSSIIAKVSNQSGVRDAYLKFNDGLGTEGKIRYNHYNKFLEINNTETNGWLQFSTENTERMRITSVGTFGMGSGSGSLAGSIIINNDGLTGTINNAHYNTVLGWEAANDLTSGDHNTLIGFQSGYKVAAGAYITSIGSYAGNTIATGGESTFVGYQAGRYATGANCTAVGSGAGAGGSSHSGAHNTCIGQDAGRLIGSGSNNTFLGKGSGSAGVTTSDNMGIGVNALSRATTGANGNIAIGNNAGKAVTTSASASQLVAIGHDVASNASGALAGYQNVFVGNNIASASGLAGAFRNTALGANALTDLTDGDNNTCVGNLAGNSINTATNNLCMGYRAGESASPSGTLTSGSNTIVLGDDNIGALYCTQSSINTSDRRDKADITNFTAGLDFIKKMQPVTYKWDRRSWYLPTDEEGNTTDNDITKVTPDGSKKENITHVGFIAQDVETLEKEIGFASNNTNRLLTDLTGDGNRYGIKYERVVTVLVNAVKELSAKNDALEARIETLEG